MTKVSSFERWRKWSDALSAGIQNGSLYAVGSPHQLAGEIRATQLGEISLLDLRAPAQVVHHDASQDAQTRNEYLVTVHDHGQVTISQNGASTELRRHDIFVRDGRAASDVSSKSPFHQVILKIPMGYADAWIGEWAQAPLHLSAETISVSAASAFVLTLAEGANLAPAQTRVRLGELALALLTACVRDCAPDQPSKSVERRFRDACDFVQLSLDDRSLDADAISKHLRISRRYLQKIFAAHGITVEQFIWRHRLLAARRDLLDPSFANLSITDVALRRGFSDTGHFSRLFRKHFEITPSSLRRLSGEL